MFEFVVHRNDLRKAQNNFLSKRPIYDYGEMLVRTRKMKFGRKTNCRKINVVVVAVVVDVVVVDVVDVVDVVVVAVVIVDVVVVHVYNNF